ncbi:methyl-accepting chemotaxis protein [Rhizobium oryziradicis]|uniref:Methyl-accepting transducer domain-containing protein n=1 Tax=Rhizobium oryziradicis TaxID=1867956 RepID=A0A1Q8ZMU1_9HYPH|nr:methyl-accepting chemotaxis protein [Rhizobium oryziradicis]OLP43076.1 hypothetical protein BJF95_19240 [Rhizobium oryziradicis]
MGKIEDEIKPWVGEERRRGEELFEHLEKHIRDVAVKCFKSFDPTTVVVPEELLRLEAVKFRRLCEGEFKREYFDTQGKVIREISNKIGFTRFIVDACSIYAIEWTLAVLKETRWSASKREAFIRTLMKGLYTDVAVAVHSLIDDMNADAEQQRAEFDRQRAEDAQADSRAMAILGKALSSLASGNLSVQLTDPLPEKHEGSRRDFNNAAEALRQAMLGISQTSEDICRGMQEISSSTSDLSRRTEQQASSLEETAAALDQITATVRRTSEGASQATIVAASAKDEAGKSSQIMKEAEVAMSEIATSSSQITQIVSVIDEIAFQTNLLALNAGVEAARAGEAGKGFAVVAQEVRALAQRSADAAKEIRGLIATSTQQVERGVTLVESTGQTLTAIVGKVTEMDRLITDIAASAREQATGLHEINTAVNHMDQVTQQNAAMVEESTAAVNEMNARSIELAKLIQRFSITGQGQAALSFTRYAA